MPRIPLLCFVLACAAWGPGCDEGDETLRAFKVGDRAELIGGAGAVGQVGDFVLENNQLRAVVLGARREDNSAIALFIDLSDFEVPHLHFLFFSVECNDLGEDSYIDPVSFTNCLCGGHQERVPLFDDFSDIIRQSAVRE